MMLEAEQLPAVDEAHQAHVEQQHEPQGLAADADRLHERLASVEEDCAIYRYIAMAALDALHAQTLRYERMRNDRDRLRDEQRHWREERLIAAAIEDDHASAV